jgi:hypothetical protein
MAKKEKSAILNVQGTPFFRIVKPLPRQKRR